MANLPLLGVDVGPVGPLLGAHMPTAGGHACALTGGHAIGCEAVQIFTASPRQWRAAAISDEMRDKFRDALADCAITKTVAHDSYLINLAAAPDSDVLAKSRAAFVSEIQRADALGVDFLVSHPGAHVGAGEEVGLARLVDSLDAVHDQTSGAKVRVALETTAGQGTYLGGRFEHLARILGAVKHPERLCVCLDTCHVFAAGYDLRTADAYEATLAEFDRIVGMAQLQVVHANDSKGILGSHLDRHAHIGEGEIGLEGFRCLVNDPRMGGLPIIVETPDSDTMHAVNITRLRELIAVPAAR